MGAATMLLDNQLTAGRFLQPYYLGTPMSLPDIARMLRDVTPALTDEARARLVQEAWWRKVANTRQLPPILDTPVQVPAPSLVPSGVSQAAHGLRSGGQIESRLDAPDTAAAGSDPSAPDWQPSLGPQLVINIFKGAGTPTVGGGLQRQYALGDNLQAVFQDASDAQSGSYTAVAGGQALGRSFIDSQIIQLQPFMQLVAGLSQMPGSFQASMTVQYSAGLQLTFKFSWITIQVSAAFQVTAQQGQDTQGAATLSATAGPTQPERGTGTQHIGDNWWFGVGAPPPLPSPGTGAPDRQLGGGMLFFGGRF
jgi:hypothetical protein